MRDQEQTAFAERDPHHTLARETLRAIAVERNGVNARACDALFIFVDTARMVRARLASVLSGHGLTEAQFFALLFLRRLWPGATTAAELAYHAGISRSAMTETLDRLEQASFVQRERSPRDRRTLRVRMRSEGRRAIDAAASHLLAEADHLTRPIAEDGLDAAVNACRTIGERAQPGSGIPA